MFLIRSFLMQFLRVIISLILTVILLIGYPSQAVAQEQSSNWIQRGINQVKAILGLGEKENGIPRERNLVGSSKRGECSALATSSNNQFEINQRSLIALIPPTTNPSRKTEQLPESFQIIWGQTIEEYPSFWFYIPFVYQKSELEYGKFVILDEDRNNVAGPIFFQLPDNNRDEKPRIAKLTLPAKVEGLKIKGLKPNKQYEWFFSILCDRRKPSRNPSVSGSIERTGENLSYLKNYQEYAKFAILYDAMTDLIGRIKKSRTAQQPQLQSTADVQLPIQNDWEQLIQYLLLSTNLNENPKDRIKITRFEDYLNLMDEMKDADIVELKTVPEKEVRDSGFEI